MGSTLTNTQPKDTYKSLLKTSDSSELSATAKYVSDGNGNDSALALSTGQVGIGTASPAAPLHTVGTVEANGSLYRGIFGGSSVQDADMTGLSGGNGSELQLQSPSTTRGSYLTIGGGLANGEALGGIAFYNSNNTDGKRLRSYLLAAQEGATANEQGGYLSFGTAADAATTPSERLRITSDGYLRMASGSLGIQFNGDTAAANALDDYEEGTFTATIAPSTSGTITSGASFNTWSYTKIGRQVTINGAFVISSVSSPVGAQLQIGGFPFTIANSLSAYGAASSMYADASASYAKTSPPTWHVVNTTELLIEYDASTVAASDEIYVTATYFV